MKVDLCEATSVDNYFDNCARKCENDEYEGDIKRLASKSSKQKIPETFFGALQI